MNLTKTLFLFILFTSITSQSCKKESIEIVPGCMDETAANYDSEANEDDGSCQTWSEYMSGTYNASLNCSLLSVINGDFPITITNIDEHNVKVSMNIQGFEALQFDGSVVENEITFVPLSIDGIDIELPDFPANITGIELGGNLTYSKEMDDIDGILKVTFKTDFIPIADNCNISGNRI